MIVAACPHCDGAVALHEGQPEVTGQTIRLWHRVCWDQRNAPIATAVAIAVALPRPFVRPRNRRWYVAPVAASLAVGVCCVHWATAGHVAPSPSITLDDSETIDPGSAQRTTAFVEPPPALAPVAHASEEPGPVPASMEKLQEKYPTLREWIHPVLSAHELSPPQECRQFGAERHGITRAECGAGHCGVDLDGPRGEQVLAVAGGTLVRIERHELGLDGRSGRYVRIQHDDGTLTAYMHLDVIADGLHVGDHVEAGQVVGLLGATATFHAAAHLHFTLELPDRADERGDLTETHYIDPAPFLRRATVLDAPIVAVAVTSPDRAASE
jgi:hypothetical protein